MGNRSIAATALAVLVAIGGLAGCAGDADVDATTLPPPPPAEGDAVFDFSLRPHFEQDFFVFTGQIVNGTDAPVSGDRRWRLERWDGDEWAPYLVFPYAGRSRTFTTACDPGSTDPECAAVPPAYDVLPGVTGYERMANIGTPPAGTYRLVQFDDLDVTSPHVELTPDEVD